MHFQDSLQFIVLSPTSVSVLPLLLWIRISKLNYLFDCQKAFKQEIPKEVKSLKQIQAIDCKNIKQTSLTKQCNNNIVRHLVCFS